MGFSSLDNTSCFGEAFDCTPPPPPSQYFVVISSTIKLFNRDKQHFVLLCRCASWRTSCFLLLSFLSPFLNRWLPAISVNAYFWWVLIFPLFNWDHGLQYCPTPRGTHPSFNCSLSSSVLLNFRFLSFLNPKHKWLTLIDQSNGLFATLCGASLSWRNQLPIYRYGFVSHPLLSLDTFLCSLSPSLEFQMNFEGPFLNPPKTWVRVMWELWRRVLSMSAMGFWTVFQVGWV